MLLYLKNNRRYFACLLAFFFVGSLLQVLLGKPLSFKLLNTIHSPLLNQFFSNVTFLGDGFFAVLLATVCFFYFRQKQQGTLLLAAFLVSGTLVQIIKRTVHAPRPRLFFPAGEYIHHVDGVSLASLGSFPSGHTTTAFAMATILVLYTKNRRWHPVILTAAVLIGYSRIYLGQHFLLDVMAGAAIGSSVALLLNALAHNRAARQTINKRLGLSTPLTTVTSTQNIQTA